MAGELYSEHGQEGLVRRQEEPPSPTVGPYYQPRYSAQLGRMILSDDMPHNYQPAWYETQARYNLPELWGPEAQARYRQFSYLAGQNPAPAPEPPGFPERVSVTLPWSQAQENPINDAMGNLLGPNTSLGAFVGAGAERTQSVDFFGVPIATTPLTLTNFSAYGREGVFALVDSILGNNYQTPDGAGWGEDNKGPVNQGPLDVLIDAFKMPFDAINNVFEGAMEFWRTENAKNRALNVINLGRTGNAMNNPNEVLSVDFLTSFLTGGTAKFNEEQAAQVAAQRGVGYDEMIAEYYDMPLDVTRDLLMNGSRYTGDEVRSIVHNMPLSQNPAVNIALEFAMQAAILVVPYAGIGRIAAAATKLGSVGEAAGFLRGLTQAENIVQRGTSLTRPLAFTERAAGATNLERAAQVAGWGTRRALQVNSINTTAGWSIRTFEWGVKQVGLVTGNQGLVDMADKMLWNMPLSMNPGFNLVTAFSSHPLEALGINTRLSRRPVGRGKSGLLGGSVLVGTPNTLGWVGEINIVGKPYHLSPAGQQMVRHIASMSFDDLRPFFDKLGPDFTKIVEAAIAEGNPDGLTLDHVKNELLHVSLTAHRDSLGDLAWAQGLAAPTLEERALRFVDEGLGVEEATEAAVKEAGEQAADLLARSREFSRTNIAPAHRLFQQELAGQGTAISDAIRGRYWEYAQLNDSQMSRVKARLAAEFDEHQGAVDFVSAMKANAYIRTAFEQNYVSADAAAVLRKSVNIDFLRSFRERIEQLYPDPKEIVDVRQLDVLKRMGGLIEAHPGGNLLVRKGKKPPPPLSRARVQKIIDQIINDEIVRRDAMAAPPRTEAAVFQRGVDPEAAQADPVQVQRALGIKTEDVEAIRAAQALDEAQLATTPIPRQVAARVAEALRMSADDLAVDPQRWQKVFDWFEAKVAQAVDTSRMRSTLEGFSRILDERAAGSAGDPNVITFGKQAAEITRDYLLNPVTRDWLRENTSMATRLAEADVVLRTIQKDIDKLALDPHRRMKMYVPPEGVAYVMPNGAIEGQMVDLLRVIEKVAADGRVPEGELGVLTDPLLHPWLKLDMLRRADLTAEERAIVEQLTLDDLSAVVKDVLGPEADATAETVAQITAGRSAWEGQVDEAAGQLYKVGARYALVDGKGHNPETRDILYRLDDLQARTGNRWREMPMRTDPVPTGEEARAAVMEPLKHNEAQRAVERAAEEARQAQRELDNLRLNDLETVWDEQPLFLRRGGRAGAAARAKEINRATGRPTEVRPRYKPGTKAVVGYEVYTGRQVPRTAAIEQKMAAGEVAESQALNIEEGIARGGTEESGGAVLSRQDQKAADVGSVLSGIAEGFAAGAAKYLFDRSIVGGERATSPAAQRIVDAARQRGITTLDEFEAFYAEAKANGGPPARVDLDAMRATEAAQEAPGEAIAPEVASSPLPFDATLPEPRSEVELFKAFNRIAEASGEPLDVAAVENIAWWSNHNPNADQLAFMLRMTDDELEGLIEQMSADILGNDAGISRSTVRQWFEEQLPVARTPEDDLYSQMLRDSQAPEVASEVNAAPEAPYTSPFDEPHRFTPAEGALKAEINGILHKYQPLHKAGVDGVPLYNIPTKKLPAWVAEEDAALTEAWDRLDAVRAEMAAAGDPVEAPLAELKALVKKEPERPVGADDIDEEIAVERTNDVRTANRARLIEWSEAARASGDPVRNALADKIQGYEYGVPMFLTVGRSHGVLEELRAELRAIVAEAEGEAALAAKVEEIAALDPAVEVPGFVPPPMREQTPWEEILSWANAHIAQEGHATGTGYVERELKRLAESLTPDQVAQVQRWIRSSRAGLKSKDREALGQVRLEVREANRALREAAAGGPERAYGADTAFQDPRTEALREVPARFRVVDANELVNSWDEGFDQALQPRKVDFERELKVEKIAAAPDHRLLNTESGAEGAPVVGPDGMVLAGNHRVEALRRAKGPAFEKYRATLLARSDEFGINPGQLAEMDRPVLVREVAPEYMTPEMARSLNQPTGGMGTAELSQSIARDITGDDLAHLELGEKVDLASALTNERNADLVRRVMGKITERERGQYMDGNVLNKQGRDLVAGAILAKVLDDPFGEIVPMLIESTDQPLGYYARGVMRAAGQLAEADALILQGARHDVRMGRYISEALAALLEERGTADLKVDTKKLTAAYKAKGMSADEAKAAAAAFKGQVADMNLADAERILREGLASTDPLVGDLAWTMFQMRTEDEVAGFLRSLAKQIKDSDDPRQGSMFGELEMVPERWRLINGAVNEINEARRAKSEGSMFGAEELPGVRAPDGTIPTTFTTTGGAESVARDVPVFGTPEEAIDARVPITENLHLEGDPLAPETYASAGKATGEVTIKSGTKNESWIAAMQSLYDDPATALAEYQQRIASAPIDRFGKADHYQEFFMANSRLLRGEATGADLIVLRELSIDGLTRFNPFGEYIGRFNAAAQPNPNPFVPAGRFRAVLETPSLTAADTAVLRDTVTDTAPFAAGDPELAATVDLTPEKVTTQSAIDSGAHTFVANRGGAHDNAARDITGASKGNPPDMVLEINEPEMATMLRLAQERLEVAQAAERTARSTLDGMAPPPEVAGPRGSAIEPLPPDVHELLIDYVQAPDRGNKSLRYFNDDKLVTTVGQAMDVIESIDQGVPSLGAPMSEADLGKLRAGLMDWVHRRADNEAGIVPGAEQRAVDAIERKRVRGTVIDSPEDWHDAVVEGWRGLEHAVKTDDAAITGWEGTQYDLGHLPLLDPDGRPLTPRVLSTEDLLALLNKVSPDIPNELVMGRKQDLFSRFSSARLAAHARGWLPDRQGKVGKVADFVAAQVRANPEKGLREATMDRYINELVGEQPTRGELEMDAEEVLKRWQKERDEAAGTIAAIHELMTDPTNLSVGGRFRKYRNEWLVGPQGFDHAIRKHLVGDNARTEWGKKFIADGTIGQEAIPHLPEWAQGFITNSNSPTPFWDAWTKSENRIRAWFSEQDNAVARYVEALYARPGARGVARKRAGIVQTYHYVRFLLDARWMALEIVEAPTLTMFRDGVGATMDAMGVEWSGLKPQRTGKFAKPMFMGLDDLSKSRADFAWWMANDYVGGTGAKLRYREAYLLEQVKRAQATEFPKVMLNMAKQDKSLAKVLREMGNTPDEWLDALNDSWELMSSLSHKIDPDTARRVYEPRLADGTINQAEFDRLIKNAESDGYHYVRIPAFEREIAAAVGNPVLSPLMERLKFLNEQAWNDGAQMIFGQTDRSNVQRFLNHPLLYWPISYQIKATKWLATLLFDRFMGVDTGSAGAFLLDKLHAEHVAAAQDDPDYQKWMSDTETIRFVAQMLLPITPFDIGVGLSPFTRLAIGTATGMFDDKEGGAEYNRNLFGFGPGYTYFELLPRLGYEMRKSDSEAAQGAGEVIGNFAPFRVTVGGTRSQKGQAERRVYGPGELPPAPEFIPPPQRLQESPNNP